MVITELKSPASCFSPYSKSKPETPKTPTTPTSPLSPSLSFGVGPLSPRLQTGDSIRDKCIEMLTAALRTDGTQNKCLTPTQTYWHIVLMFIIVEMMLTICFSFLLDDFKDYGANCEGMAAEIEDHILCVHYWLTVTCFVKMSIESSWSHCLKFKSRSP